MQPYTFFFNAPLKRYCTDVDESIDYFGNCKQRIQPTFCLSFAVIPCNPFCGGSTISAMGNSGCLCCNNDNMLLPCRHICLRSANGFKNSI